MGKHVFGKYEVGFCCDPRSGGIYLDPYEKCPTWLWYRADEVLHYSADDYGLQEE